MINQLKVLTAIGVCETEQAERSIEILTKGYRSEYGHLIGYVSRIESLVDMEYEVREILQMFREIRWALEKFDLTDVRHKALADFWGFDGNSNFDHLCFADFLLTQGEYAELGLSMGCPDSHSDTIETMRCMVRVWNKLARKGIRMTKEDLLAILDAPLIERLPLPNGADLPL